MAGTIIFTGANTSLGIPAAEHILRLCPQHTAIFTVRDDSTSDPNTRKLRETIARYPQAKTSVHALDLASLSSTHAFTDTVISGIKSGQYPPPFGPTGRVVLLSSDSHRPGKNAMEKYAPSIPSNLELLVKPSIDDDKMGRGYQRYATAKLAITMWMYALNEHLQEDPILKNITTVAINPGRLPCIAQPYSKEHVTHANLRLQALAPSPQALYGSYPTHRSPSSRRRS
ncbi:hypothetical protein KVR01_010533 [Diaporthe batatas]|uniref:uncharacterized protein n=1 Tax=Diaporthe batatas TaxID=748121 RepID=UPI001D044364|nr:uncharacterized protein KVR01_010533 [Diaporthe batatas]KAG8159896.1 hypothetical protein KVR01_010533 [Diaporthe batatas]